MTAIHPDMTDGSEADREVYTDTASGRKSFYNKKDFHQYLPIDKAEGTKSERK